mmetsp:Transcript_4840/g.19365  ORF Transcript_4840/g.19365 Transcript_4840/m.19365 type:complete len:309 (-) Transcript_4840:52-978(-)
MRWNAIFSSSDGLPILLLRSIFQNLKERRKHSLRGRQRSQPQRVLPVCQSIADHSGLQRLSPQKSKKRLGPLEQVLVPRLDGHRRTKKGQDVAKLPLAVDRSEALRQPKQQERTGRSKGSDVQIHFAGLAEQPSTHELLRIFRAQHRGFHQRIRHRVPLGRKAVQSDATGGEVLRQLEACGIGEGRPDLLRAHASLGRLPSAQQVRVLKSAPGQGRLRGDVWPRSELAKVLPNRSVMESHVRGADRAAKMVTSRARPLRSGLFGFGLCAAAAEGGGHVALLSSRPHLSASDAPLNTEESPRPLPRPLI